MNGKGDGGERHDMAERASVIAFVREIRDVTDSASGKGLGGET